MGYNKRTQIRSTTTAACMPVLKANSVQGFLVSGSREKRVSWEAEELMAAFTRPSFEPRFGFESFSAPGSVGSLGLQGVEESIVYYLKAGCLVAKSARQRPFPPQIGKSIPLIFQLLMLSAPTTGPDRVRKSKKLHLKRAFTSGPAPLLPRSWHGALGLAAHNLVTVDALSGIAGVDHQLGFADDLLVVVV